MNGMYSPPPKICNFLKKKSGKCNSIPTTFPCKGRLGPIITDIKCFPQPKHNEERDGGVVCFQRKEKKYAYKYAGQN